MVKNIPLHVSTHKTFDKIDLLLSLCYGVMNHSVLKILGEFNLKNVVVL